MRLERLFIDQHYLFGPDLKLGKNVVVIHLWLRQDSRNQSGAHMVLFLLQLLPML